MLAALLEVTDAANVTAIANVGDDLELHGLRISPDLDTITYTLAGAINPGHGVGPGRRVMAGHGYGAPLRRHRLVRLRDRDLGTISTGPSGTPKEPPSPRSPPRSSCVGLGLRVLPVTDDRLRTMITLAGDGEDAGREVSFRSTS